MLDEIIQRTFLVGKSYITGTNPNSKVSFPTSVKEKELSSLNLNNPPLLQKSAEVAICSNQIQLGGGGGWVGRGKGGRGAGEGGARGGGRGISGAVFSSVCLLLTFVLLFIPLQSFDYLALLNINTHVIPGALATLESRIR